jgi:WD40 repeat protein
MAQEVRWLDAEHFAVGRWDGSMSVFTFQTAPYQGPIISEAVNDPALQGVQMITPLPRSGIATSNDYSSLALWHARGGDWTRLVLRATYAYDPAFGTARSGAWIAGSGQRLVVGHSNGVLSVWRYDASTLTLTFERSVDVRNPQPTNPWNDHTIEDVVVADANQGVVAAGSEDGYVTMLHLPSGTILSQTVFNPQAQRGINAVTVSGNRLIVANCSVGPDDYNTWYFSIDKSDWSITLLDRKNLVIDTGRPQVFNFDIVWGRYSGGRCWFASTEEGALWMGTASADSLTPSGYQQLTAPLGSALAYQNGDLVMVAYDLYQFTTDA